MLCVCVCVHMWGINAPIIHCFKHVLRTYFTYFEGELYVSYAFTLKGIYVHLCWK